VQDNSSPSTSQRQPLGKNVDLEENMGKI